jgi:RNA polymerase sigma-70 factor (ECF subfamily)
VSELYDEVRPLLFSIAYRMLGSASDADDIVQEAFLRFYRESEKGTTIASPRSFLSVITTRLCIDHLRSARVRRECYVGTWLPEPVPTDSEVEEPPHINTADTLSMAFLVLLESLTPVERAVFLLREVFDYQYDQIAEIVDKSEENCRQIAVRARRQVEQKRPRFESSRARRDELARHFFEAVVTEDTTGLVNLLAADVVFYADGGGKAATLFPRPIYGREQVARVLLAAAVRDGEHVRVGGERLRLSDVRFATVNGQPGAFFLGIQGNPVVVITLDIADGVVQTIRSISNPEKLSHLNSFLTQRGTETCHRQAFPPS